MTFTRTRICALKAACLIMLPASLLAQSAPENSTHTAGVRCANSPDLVDSCFTFRGRLSFSNGTPDCRIWRIGTKRMIGILDPTKPGEHNENPSLPDGVQCYPGRNTYADFTVCPYTAERPGEMQMVCVESASNLFVIHYAGVCELLHQPDHFSGKRVKLEGRVQANEDTIAISDDRCPGSILLVADAASQSGENHPTLRDLVQQPHPALATVVGQFQFKRGGSGFGPQNSLRSRLVVQSIEALPRR